MLHLIIHVPRVEALRTSTLGYEIATPTELPRVRTIIDGLLISLSSPCSINEWRTTCTAIPPTAPLHLIIYIGRTSLPTSRHEKAPDRVGAVPSTSNCFFTGDSRTFFTAAGRFLNRGGCCRHAAHDGGDGGMTPTGNSYIHAHKQHTLHDVRHVSCGNSVGVAIPQPRVAGEARYPGYAPPLTLLLCKSCYPF